MDNLYTFSFQVHVNDKDIEDFLTAVAGSINDMGKPVLNTKLKHKMKHGTLHMEIKVKFIDGTEMMFKHKSPFNFEYDFVEVPFDQLQGMMGQQAGLDLLGALGLGGEEEDKKDTKKIGFQVPVEVEDEEDEEE